jgi:hypothetical protein
MTTTAVPADTEPVTGLAAIAYPGGRAVRMHPARRLTAPVVCAA